MSQTAHAGSAKPLLPHYVVISFLTLLTICPQYVLNVSYILNQGLLENTVTAGTYAMTVPSLVSNMLFALCVPMGPVLSRYLGLRRSYLALVAVFVLGALISGCSSELWVLVLGRGLQGLTAGALFLTILPVSLVSFPNHVRNWFLLLAIGGLFGSTSLGAVFGAMSLGADAWRLFYLICGVPGLLALLVGSRVLPHSEAHHGHHPFDIRGLVCLVLAIASLIWPLAHLQKLGIGDWNVWPWLVLAAVFLALFVWNELRVEGPLVHFRALATPRQWLGVLMAAASHVALVAILIGSTSFLRSVRGAVPHQMTVFYLSFFIGCVIAALLCVWLHDLIGPGWLGVLASLTVLGVAALWRQMSVDADWPSLYLQMGLAGSCIGVVLVSGALSTALSGDIHQARWRSVSLHFMRNVLGAAAAPVFAWFLTRQSAVHYEQLRAQFSLANPMETAGLTGQVQRLMGQGMSSTDAQNVVTQMLASSAKATSLANADRDLFLLLCVLGFILLAGSLALAMSGRGRRLVQKGMPAQSHQIRDLPARVS
ncbi:MFS transporter [Alicyclobacillus herbarius]|uniref:MFS transporter n=1 Tax=Alicyclobacillus herbarius TaxID=122960 RepID=UPI0003FF2137|nr:MFS transporter [Alicyclobacillus herbarius]